MGQRLAGVCIVLAFLAVTAPARTETGRNLLDREASPYLQLHAADPVHWRAWSADSLARAKARRFDRTARERAGLSEAFIEAVRTARSTQETGLGRGVSQK